MRRALPIACLLVLLLVPATARAHELTVLAPGSAELDLGTVSSPRLVHATLEGERDALDLAVRNPAAPLDVLVLVPDAQPERGSTARPKLSIEGVELVEDEELVDEATGIRYLVVARHRLDPRVLSSPIGLRIARGDEPTRVAVYVGDPDAQFIATDPERTPRTLVRLRAWAETPAAGSTPVRAAVSRDSRSRAPWYGAAIALVAVLTSVWWIRSGSRRAQERGIERSAGED